MKAFRIWVSAVCSCRTKYLKPFHPSRLSGTRLFSTSSTTCLGSAVYQASLTHLQHRCIWTQSTSTSRHQRKEGRNYTHCTHQLWQLCPFHARGCSQRRELDWKCRLLSLLLADCKRHLCQRCFWTCCAVEFVRWHRAIHLLQPAHFLWQTREQSAAAQNVKSQSYE